MKSIDTARGSLSRPLRDTPTGKTGGGAAKVNSDRKWKFEFQWSKTASGARLRAYREIDKAFGLTSAFDSELHNASPGKNIQHDLAALLRQSLYSGLAGNSHVTDIEASAFDPLVWNAARGQDAELLTASACAASPFEAAILAQPESLAFLRNLAGLWVDRIHKSRPPRQIILDLDASTILPRGNWEEPDCDRGSEQALHNPLFCFNQYGDMERAILRTDRVHSEDHWHDVLEPVIARYRDHLVLRLFRGDMGLFDYQACRRLEADGYFYAIRLKGNQVLHGKIEHLLIRPPEHRPKKRIVLYCNFRYQAADWEIPRRVVAAIEWHVHGPFPRVSFIATNLPWKSAHVARFYNKRGTMSKWIKESHCVLKWARSADLEVADDVASQARFQLFVLAYNLGNFYRRLAST